MHVKLQLRESVWSLTRLNKLSILLHVAKVKLDSRIVEMKAVNETKKQSNFVFFTRVKSTIKSQVRYTSSATGEIALASYSV